MALEDQLTEGRRFAARVSPDGRLVLADEPAWKVFLLRWRQRLVSVWVEPFRPTRSNPQNRWYRGVIVPAVAGELSKGRDLPLSNDQAHYVLKAAFIGQEETALGPTPISTTTLSTVQFSEYCERIRAHAASEWGLNIPSPNEREPVGGWEQ